ncbi:gamma carbonic anhydrase family protein [Kitasatospora atroaurantiaca]|uniref:Carbonic anhydrase/acetyltransferase-like protein (Isoleucine patch superfamily) n=1 Tax=Kitasatospora atroaurantiaca TaxID=285545 RepID=A0A561EIA3_9ACTN|nr:gamma carbonic anhydrase family protein [Kitasatospora atroaurantiaca]TWE15349.1 carbonic anhydrase/acetyltransferase-like protein (isoleucine patch superfamily) [Kitasatospora atroaurantiaca]
MAEPLIAAVAGLTPDIHPTAFVAPNAVVVGSVGVGERTSIWYGAVLRGDSGTVTVGAGSNIQDNCTLHADPGFPLVVGDRVTVGHNAVLHGCTVEDDVLVGMGSVVLNGARVGAGSLIAAGAVLPQGLQVPPGSLVAGVPGKVRRELTEEERAGIKVNGEGYLMLAQAHAEAVAEATGKA